ncbi:unnamed protein product [Effrenium voratum]|nr:unnamed protein product [Effrenium voratum]
MRRCFRRCAASCQNPLGLPDAVFAKESPCPHIDGLCYFSSDWADMQLPSKHRFPIDKYQMVRGLLEAEDFRVLPGPLATFHEATLAHEPSYVRRILRGDATEEMRRRVGFREAPMEGYVLRTLASLGATVAAARHTLRTGIWSGATSGGTHHAFADAGEGFCVFNDIAVAARLAQQEFGVTRVLVIDLDVHQGNGTAKIFAGDSRVYTVSVHQKKGYPFSTRFPSDLEVDLPDGCDDEQFLQALQPLEALVKRQAPQLIIYQAGVDGLAGDRFGRWNLTRPGLQARNDLVYSLAAAHGIPLILTMGGGYHKDILQTVEASADAYRQALAWQSAKEFGVGEDGNGQTVYVYDASQEINDLGVLVMRRPSRVRAWYIHDSCGDRCPLTGKNVNPFTTEVWRSIHAEFVRAASLLQAGHSLQELCEPAEALPSGCGHRGGGLGVEIAAALVWDEELPNEQKMRSPLRRHLEFL